MNKRAGNFQILPWLLFFPAFLAAYAETVLSLYKRWIQFDEAYGHGFLVLLIVIYLVYDKRKEIVKTPSTPKYYLAIPLLLFSALWFLAFQTDIEIVQQLLLPLMLIIMIAMVHGYRMSNLLWFPVAFLYFAIPAWDYLNDLLISFTVAIVSNFVRLSGITAFIDADRITLSSGTIVIAAGCSGLRYLIICTALAALAAWLADVRIALRYLVVSLGIMIGLVTNWVRVYLLVLVGYFTDMESGLLHEHEMFGWILFLVFFSPLYLLTSRMRPQMDRSSEDAYAMVSRGQDRRQIFVWILACLTLGSGPLAAHIADYAMERHLQADIPDLSGYHDLESHPLPPEDSVYYFLDNAHKPETVAAEEYEVGDVRILLTTAIYRKNMSTRNYMPFYRSIFDPEKWRKTRERARSVDGFQRLLRIKELELTSRQTGDRNLVWYWFDIGGQVSHNTYISKLLEVWAIFTGRNYAGLTIIQADCQSECEALRDVFAGLARHADRALTQAVTR